MSKLVLDQAVPATYDKSRLQDIIRAICGQVNKLSEGAIAAKYNAQSSVPGGTTVSYAVGDFVPDSNCTVTNGSVRLGWVCTAPGTPGTFQEARVLVANFGQLTNSLAADVTMNNTSNYFDGPSVAQGTSGTWFASGTVTLVQGSGTTENVLVKLWDGTTVIASTAAELLNAANSLVPVSLSGFITNPAGNIRISVRDTSSTLGVIKANATGNSKDSTITVLRIG